MLKKISLILCLSAVYVFSFGQEHSIIPSPQQVTLHKSLTPLSKAVLNACTQFKYQEDSLKYVVDIFKSFQTKGTQNPSPKFNIEWIKSKAIASPEGYSLNISNQKITITYQHYAAALYGTMSLVQLLLNDDISLANQTITDAPRYPFRALMVDPARHFLTLQELQQYIRLMAMYKYNALHLHLNDDQGWRIEIKSHPEIAQKGGEVNGKSLYYTQQELKDLIAYATQYGVEIIPEIDIPGHNTSLLVSHPELACTPQTFKLWTTAGVSKDILCAGNDSTYLFLNDILNEVCQLFPSSKIHLGGDEAPLDHWKTCPKCQAKMRSLQLKTPQDLMSYFLIKNSEILIKNGKKALFWYELDVPKYPENAICYFWRWGKSKEVISKFTGSHTPLIASSGEYSYFDYPQSDKDISPADWMPVTTFEQVSRFEPTWKMPAADTQNIIGVEATLWGEFIPNVQQAFYMTFPRALAYAEAGWSQPQNRSLQNLKNQLPSQLRMLMKLGINHRVPYELYP